MVRLTLLFVSVVVLAGASDARGQDADELKRLKKQVEDLQAKLEAATQKLEQLEKENQQLKAGGGGPAPKAPAKDAAKDPFAKGAVWAGTRKFEGGPEKQKWDLTVTERPGDGSFKGELRLIGPKGNATSYPVSGFLPTGDGPVTFVAEKGQFRQTFKGKLKNGQVGVDFSGTTQTGGQVKGDAFLDPK